MNKWRNKWTEVDGKRFQSQKEANRYVELDLLERSGQIFNLKLQPKFVLLPKFTYRGEKVRAITYKADFSYIENGQLVVEDVKGKQTEAFKLKWKFVRHQNPEIEFRIT